VFTEVEAGTTAVQQIMEVGEAQKMELLALVPEVRGDQEEYF